MGLISFIIKQEQEEYQIPLLLEAEYIYLTVRLAEKEIYVFFDACDEHVLPAAMRAIQTHLLSDSQVKKVFDDLGLVNVTDQEATLFSLQGEMISLPL